MLKKDRQTHILKVVLCQSLAEFQPETDGPCPKSMFEKGSYR
jgi:hypothetical protein